VASGGSGIAHADGGSSSSASSSSSSSHASSPASPVSATTNSLQSPKDQSFHLLRHTYASLCLAAGIRPIDIAALMGHRDVKTTLTVYAHLIKTDDHTGNMAALGALAAPVTVPSNVIPLHG
jgi:hypothetical protein